MALAVQPPAKASIAIAMCGFESERFSGEFRVDLNGIS
jgi:hypothetical protein